MTDPRQPDPLQPEQPSAGGQAPDDRYRRPDATQPSPDAGDRPARYSAADTFLASPEPTAPPSARPAVPEQTLVMERPEPERPARSSRARWIVALGSTLLVLVAAVAIVFLSQRGTTETAGGPRYMAPDTAFYGELRLDLPGDQRENLGRFLSKFPGFADPSSLDVKLDDVLDRLIGQGTEQKYTYTKDVKPWFGGQLSISMQAPDDLTTSEPAAAAPLAVLAVTDRAKAQEVLDRLRQDAQAQGTTWVSNEHNGATIWSSALPEATGEIDGFHMALTDDALLLGGNSAEMRAAIDRAKGESSAQLGGVRGFSDALNGLRTDRLATFYINTASIKQAAEQALGEDPNAPGAQTAREFLKKLPDSVVATMHVEPDRLVADTRSRMPGEQPGVKESALADNAPGDSLAYFELRDVGKGLRELIVQLKADPALESAAPQLSQVEAFLGTRAEEYLSWIGDVGVAVGKDGDNPSVVLVATATDAGAGKARIDQLVALARLGGQQLPGLEITDSDHGGVEITTLAYDIGSLPFGTDGAVEAQRAEISYAFKDDLFIMGVGEQAVIDILDLGAADSLAASQRFRDALNAAGGTSNAGVTWIDLSGARSAFEPLLEGEMRTHYDKEIKPYLEPIDMLVGVQVRDGDFTVQRTLFIVK
jgi:hypothetical protein